MCAMVMFSLHSNVETTELSTGMINNSPTHLLLRSRLGGLFSRPPNMRCFAPLIQECVSMVTLVCAHSPIVLTTSELVLCPPGNDMDYIRN